MSDLDIRIWEVGAGLCVRIRTPGGQNHIIDAGNSDEFSPAEHIYKYHWHKSDSLDFLIISHQDADHVRDLENIKKYLGEPKTYLRNKSVPENEKYGLLQRIYQRILKAFDQKYTVTTPWETSPRNPSINGGVRIKSAQLDWAEAGSINDSSIVVAYEYKGVLIIFPGDIEDSGWQKLIAKNSCLFGDLLEEANIVILLAPHHGRKSGYSQGMIDYFRPNLIVVSDGYGAGETDPRFRKCASGLKIGGELKNSLRQKPKVEKELPSLPMVPFIYTKQTSARVF